MAHLPVVDISSFHIRGLLPRLAPEGDVIQENVPAMGPSVVARAPQSSTSSSDGQVMSCGPKDTTGPCRRNNADSSPTMPIVLGVVIPLTVAFTLMIIFHRRHVKKLRREDAEDANKSLDFGYDRSPMSQIKKQKKGRNAPEMSVSQARGMVRADRGVSLDLGTANPYLLPPELQQSRESLQSLSRSINTGDDKYRATTFVPDDGSIRSPSSLRSHWDDASTIHTAPSRGRVDSGSTRGLLPQPRVMVTESHGPAKPTPVAPNTDSLLAPGAQDPVRDSYVSTNSHNGNIAALRASNNYLGQFISGGKQTRSESPAKANVRTSVLELEGSNPSSHLPAVTAEISTNEEEHHPSRAPVPALTPAPVQALAPVFDFNVSSVRPENPPRQSVMYHELATENNRRSGHLDPSVQTSQQYNRRSSIYEDDVIAYSHVEPNRDSVQEHVTALPAVQESAPSRLISTVPSSKHDSIHGHDSDYYEDDDKHDADDLHEDALGYDPRLLGMGQRPLPPDDPSENPEERALRIRSFYKEYFDDSSKPSTGVKAPVTYYDGSENYIDDYYGTAHSSPYTSRTPHAYSYVPPGRHRATISNGTYHGPEARAYSSASGRMEPRRPPPRKNMPPPAPLMVLPTPSRLQDDSMLPNAIDYAPPQAFKNQRAGTPDSMKGGRRAYAMPNKAHNPLVSSFDDLTVLPSPHQLRKSGTFSSLDFAPPRFATPDGNASDAGSIRSNRSGVSAMHQRNIRTGAYRVSRIPREVAGTKDELSMALRPRMDMNR